MKQITILLFLIITNSIFSQNLAIDTEKYSIQYPENWTKEPLEGFNVELMLFSQLESDQDTFRENINLIIQDLSAYEGVGLDKFVKISTQQIEKVISGKLISSTRKKDKNGVSYQEFITTTKHGQFDLKIKQYFWVIDKKAYVLTFTAEAKSYNKHIEIADKMLNSFSIKS